MVGKLMHVWSWFSAIGVVGIVFIVNSKPKQR